MEADDDLSWLNKENIGFKRVFIPNDRFKAFFVRISYSNYGNPVIVENMVFPFTIFCESFD